MIIAPHDISEKHIRQIRENLASINPDQVYLIDTVGILSQLYQYARFVYIGGGFGVNIHNIQEPVTFGCPVVFGPKYKSFKEAVDLVRLGGAFSINGQEELNQIFDRLIGDETLYQQASETCREYLKSQLGATDTIMKRITSTFYA
jgi:3-deoxy-D-manno-octulosonic-acid transferase